MSVSDELKDYLENLLKPLATHETIKELFEKFETDIISKFEEKIRAQDEKIEQLESKLAMRMNTIDVLLDKLQVRCDDNEQYSRRNCLRIHGVECAENGNEDVTKILKNCYEESGIEFNEKDVDRVHRIGKSYENDDGKMVRPIIVKFRSWNARNKFYKSRPRSHVKGVKKPCAQTFRVSLDLTKRRLDLLRNARQLCENHERVAFVFADMNCSLVVKDINDKFHYFSTLKGLNDILGQI